jgi:hypothetical protein
MVTRSNTAHGLGIYAFFYFLDLGNFLRWSLFFKVRGPLHFMFPTHRLYNWFNTIVVVSQQNWFLFSSTMIDLDKEE